MSLASPKRLSSPPPSEKFITDYWNVTRDNPAGGDPMRADRSLSEPWTGRTIFNILRQPLPEGWAWVRGRPTRLQKTNRPPSIWPEFWKMLSSKQKEQAAREWALEKPKLEAAQAARGFKHVPENDKKVPKHYKRSQSTTRTRRASSYVMHPVRMLYGGF